MHWLDPERLVKDFGYLGLFLIIFTESGVFFGFFLPGDSLLFAAGLLASQGLMNIFLIIPICILAAILGNNVGYYTGKRAGPALFDKKKSKLFSPKRVAEAHEFFEKQGGKALVFARFIPAVRTFVPIIAGVAKMNYQHFFTYNMLGAIIWGTLLPVLGYTMGKTVPNIDQYLLPVVLLIIIASAMPVLISYYKKRTPTRGVKNK